MFKYGMDLDTPSNASFILEKLREEEAINLYPKAKPLTEAEQYIQDMQTFYESTQEPLDYAKQDIENRSVVKENTKAGLLAAGLYTTFVEPVCESLLATTREKDIAYNIIESMIKENGADDMLHMMRYKNIYLAECAHACDKAYESFCEGMNCKIKEGLSEKDVCEIEDKDIKQYMDDCKDNTSKDITNKIFRRVEGAINDFIDDKKKTQFKIKQIYADAKKKVDDYNQASSAMNIVSQTDGDTMSGMDPDTNASDNINAKTDNQFNQELSGPSGDMTPAQEAMSWARGQESDILDEDYNFFDAMVRVIVESAHKNDSLKSSYINENGKMNFNKVISDARGMYTVLEAFNTINLIDVDEDYLKKTIREMYESSI